MPIAELTRINDIASGDACLVPERKIMYQNPIETWFDNSDLIAKYGANEVKRIIAWAKAKAPLDPRSDTPLPNWAVDILRLGRISYKGRIRILMTHAEDILRFRLLKQRSAK